ncbi:unnamed protein product [Moneuplotes crassus]|uniref:Uncharacterized protein n=1 Tax=Euplotes crassus TaxID=5936 RepID=A0AAD1UN97_EUPCR|nr:unnamed protein product [Moneuplotes crassus]
MESIAKVIEEEDTEIISLEKSILAKTKRQDITRCQSILYNGFPRLKEIKPLVSDSGEASRNNFLSFYCSDLRDVKLARNLKHLKFFDTYRILFVHVDSKNRHFVNFLESSFPNKTNDLGFCSRYGMGLDRSNYLNPLLRLSSKVVQTVSFRSFTIGLPSLKRLVVAYKHVRVLRLICCKLSIPSVPDFSKALTNCQIQQLDLEGTGTAGLSGCGNNFYLFKNLIQGLASSPDLRLSLKEVVIYKCGVSQSEAEQMFEQNLLEGVKIFPRY